jgi:hypothetical protein
MDTRSLPVDSGLGLYGLLAGAKHYERHKLHIDHAAVLRKRLDEMSDQLNIEADRESAHRPMTKHIHGFAVFASAIYGPAFTSF